MRSMTTTSTGPRAFFSFNPSCSCSAVNTDDTVIPEQVTARWASVAVIVDPDRRDRLE